MTPTPLELFRKFIRFGGANCPKTVHIWVYKYVYFYWILNICVQRRPSQLWYNCKIPSMPKKLWHLTSFKKNKRRWGSTTRARPVLSGYFFKPCTSYVQIKQSKRKRRSKNPFQGLCKYAAAFAGSNVIDILFMDVALSSKKGYHFFMFMPIPTSWYAEGSTT